MDGWEIKDVEAQRRESRQLHFAIGKRPVTARCRPARPREQLVPGGEARPLALDDDAKRLRGRCEVAIGAGVHQLEELVAQRQLAPRTQLDIHGQRARDLAHPLRRRSRCALDRISNQRCSGLQGQRDLVLVGGVAADEVVAPGQKGVDPADQLILIATELDGHEFTVPAVVAEQRHRRLGPVAAGGMAVAQQAAQLIVAVGEDVRLDDHGLARRALDREPPVVDLWLHILDHDRFQRHVAARRAGCGVAVRRARRRVAVRRAQPGGFPRFGGRHQPLLNTTMPSGGRVALSE